MKMEMDLISQRRKVKTVVMARVWDALAAMDWMDLYLTMKKKEGDEDLVKVAEKVVQVEERIQ